MGFDIHKSPIDATSARALADRDLRFDLLDTGDIAAYDSWLQAVTRGFHGPVLDADGLELHRTDLVDERMSGVWDAASADPATPIATASGWLTELTVPGTRSVPAWAISSITVAPTHRRRTIARNLIESELRQAQSLGVPVAILTVTEATIYARFGFAPSARIATWKIDPTRARWNGPTAPGRVHIVPTENVRDNGGHELLERLRLSLPGQIQFDGMLWRRLFGTPGTPEAKEIRVARYDGEVGQLQGFAVYRVTRAGHLDASAELDYLLAATDDAYSALWRYLLELDLVTSLTAEMRVVEEPVYWQVTDPRAVVKTSESDHLWTRILDVKATLEARTYSSPGGIILEVDDALGFAAGRYLLDIAADGTASVSVHAGPLGDFDGLALGVAELGAIYLGGASVSTLVRAGRIRELRAGAAEAADASFRSAVTPWLSIWF